MFVFFVNLPAPLQHRHEIDLYFRHSHLICNPTMTVTVWPESAEFGPIAQWSEYFAGSARGPGLEPLLGHVLFHPQCHLVA